MSHRAPLAQSRASVSPRNCRTPWHRRQHRRKTTRSRPALAARRAARRNDAQQPSRPGCGGCKGQLMNLSKHHHDSAADEQAALWAARLDGDTLDRVQRTELDAWLAQNPTHRVLLSQYCQFSADLEGQVPALVASGAIVMPAAKTRRRVSGFKLMAGVALAAAAAVAVTISVVRPSSGVQHFAKASAQRGTETLSDGTRVELNAN